MTLWLNGRLIPRETARIDPTDRGFTLGDGLFETMRAQDGIVLRLERHLRRLRSGCAGLGIPLALSDGDLAQAMQALLTSHALTNGVFRLTLTRGPAPRGLATPNPMQPTLLITLAAGAPPPPPARAIIASVTRRNEHSPLSRFKTLNMLDNILAKREAEQAGADDALLLNGQGHLAESTIANLFAVIDGLLLTPPVADGALPGVMRADILDSGMAEEKSLSPADLARATETFLTNANHIRPLIVIAGQAVGNEMVGPVTKRIMESLGS